MLRSGAFQPPLLALPRRTLTTVHATLVKMENVVNTVDRFFLVVILRIYVNILSVFLPRRSPPPNVAYSAPCGKTNTKRGELWMGVDMATSRKERSAS